MAFCFFATPVDLFVMPLGFAACLAAPRLGGCVRLGVCVVLSTSSRASCRLPFIHGFKERCLLPSTTCLISGMNKLVPSSSPSGQLLDGWSWPESDAEVVVVDLGAEVELPLGLVLGIEAGSSGAAGGRRSSSRSGGSGGSLDGDEGGLDSGGSCGDSGGRATASGTLHALGVPVAGGVSNWSRTF